MPPQPAALPRRFRNRSHRLPPHLLPLCLPLLAHGALAQQPGPVNAAELDWQPLQSLDQSQRARVEGPCCGLYLEPTLPPLEAGPEDILFDADDLSGSLDDALNLRGEVMLRQGDLLLQGERGVYRRAEEQAELEGDVRLRQPGVLITGNRASVDRASASSRIEQASYLLHDERLRGSAEVVVYTDNDGIITIDNGVFTRCEPGDNSWLITGDDIRLDREAGQGVARDVTLQVGGLPMFYMPWLRFPITDERMSGFLAPVIGSTRDGGLDVATPYYFNLAPNYDATFTPRLLSDRGLMLGLEARYLGRQSLSQAEFAWLPDDRQYDAEEATQPGSDSPPQANRWLLDLNHQQRLGRGWSAYVDYSAVSDEEYFQDLGSTGFEITTQSYLTRAGQLRYSSEHWRFTGSALGYQVIDPWVPELSLPYDRLPELRLKGNYWLGDHLEYGLNAEYVHFRRDLDEQELSQTEIANGALVSGRRLSIEPEISLPWRSPGAFIVPSARYRYASYELEDQALGVADKLERGVLVSSIDSGLIFERELEFGDEDLVQTLEPRLFYLYSEYEDQSDIPLFDSSTMTFSFSQLFREDRFSGQDRVGDSNHLAAALSTRFLDSAGREKASASIGQIFYFEDRRVTLRGVPDGDQRRGTSSVVSELNYRFNDNWRASSYLEWDTHDKQLDVGTFQFRYQSAINHILNISYRYRDLPGQLGSSPLSRQIDQTDIAGLWPLNERWSLIGRWNYDHANQRDLETIAGFQYSNCCWNLRLVARRWIDNNSLYWGEQEENSGVFLQFELSGLGSVLGGNVSGMLSDGISGFREQEF